MLFYISLLIASVILAIAIVWLFRVVIDVVSKAANKGRLAIYKGGPTGFLADGASPAVASGAPSPWGSGEHSKPSQVARTTAAAKAAPTPWGWPGNDLKGQEQKPEKDFHAALTQANFAYEQRRKDMQKEAWPTSEGNIGITGKPYKVATKPYTLAAEVEPEVEPAGVDVNAKGKPWGW